jgi:hypothetical protein
LFQIPKDKIYHWVFAGLEHKLWDLFGNNRQVWQKYVDWYGTAELSFKAGEYYIDQANWVVAMIELLGNTVDWRAVLQTADQEMLGPYPQELYDAAGMEKPADDEFWDGEAGDDEF